MRAVLFSLCVGFSLACGQTEVVPDSGGMDMDTGVSMDDGGTMDDVMDEPIPFPAPHPPMPQVVTTGGPVLKTGYKVVPVFYSSDVPSTQMTVESFLKSLTGSAYWTAITTEYGAGDFTVEPTVVIQTAPPASISDNQIRQYIASQADGTHMPWPKADGNTLYAMFYPTGTTVTLQNSTSCTSFGAYHNNGALGDGTPFPYAVMPRCPGGIDILTASTSHELVEAATDPFPQGQGAYGQVDNDHLVWEFSSSGGEVGDMCEADQDSYQRLVGNFLVQRSWSNASAKAGHDPCVPPIPKIAYFNAVPVLSDTIMLSFGQGITTKGVKIPVGMMKTIDVDLFSDKACPPWTVTAQQENGSGNLQFSLDATQGQNGDVLHLTITAVSTTQFGAAVFSMSSTDGNYTHKYFGLVQFQ